MVRSVAYRMFAIGVAAGITGAAQASYYTVVDVGGQLGAADTHLLGLNNAGQVIGCANSQCFLWSNANGFTNLAFRPRYLNNAGQIAYQDDPYSTGTGAQLWTAGTTTLLGAPSYYYETLSGLNDTGVGVGSFIRYQGDIPDVARYGAGSASKLNGSSQIQPRDASDINNAGTVIGSATVGPSGSTYKPFIANDLQAQFITTLNTSGYGTVSDINENGTVVGASNVQGTNDTHAFLWTKASGPTDLGTAGGLANSYAGAINDLDAIVGSSSANGLNAQSIATLWLNGQAFDINDYVGDYAGLFTAAWAINNSGTVIATIKTGTNMSRDVLLVPTGRFVANPPSTSPAPEPASWVMMIAGMGLAGGAMRRQQRRRVRFA